MVTPVEVITAISAITTALAAVGVFRRVNAFLDTVGENKRRIDDHDDQLESHRERLNKHGKDLNEYQSRLNTHAERLDEHDRLFHGEDSVDEWGGFVQLVTELTEVSRENRRRFEELSDEVES